MKRNFFLLTMLYCSSLLAEDAVVPSTEAEAIEATTTTPLEPVKKIFQWTDKNGRTHFSDEASDTYPSLEISEKLQNHGSIYTFSKPDIRQLAPLPTATKNIGTGISVVFITEDMPVSPQQKQQIIKYIQQMYQKYVQWFGWPATASRPIKIRLFKNIDKFEQHSKSIGKNSKLGFRHGYYNGECVVWGDSVESTMETILHEASHHITNLRRKGIPTWLDEGLAMHLGSYNNQVLIGREPFAASVIPMKLREGSLGHISEYLNLSNSNFHQLDTQNRRVELSYYLASWSIVNFLVNTPKGRSALRTSINLANQGTPFTEALAQSYGGGLEKLNNDWRASQ
jgi:hypothetical protein